MDSDTPTELGVDKEASAVETPNTMDVPEEPEAWDSGSERGDWDPEPDKEEVGGQDSVDKERMNTRGGM